MKHKNTLRALLASVMALVLCCSMLIGSTFAWFTDSASSGVNKIVAGNLDIKFEYSTDKMATWKDAEKATDVFSANKWEPGYTEVVYFRVTNNGSLALDYKVATNVVQETEGVNQAGNQFKLSEFLQFGIVDTTTAFADRTAARNAVTTPNKFSNVGTNETRLEKKGDSATFAVVVWMPETTNNDANHNGKKVPEIQFGVNVIAAQADVEKDSFDEKYDENAKYPDAPKLDAIVAQVGTATDLKNILDVAFQNGGTGDVTVTLTQNIDVADQWDTFAVPNTAANITIDGAGYTISNLNKPLVTGLWGGYGTLTFKNLTIDSAEITDYNATQAGGSLDACGAFMAYADAATKIIFDDCHLTNSKVAGNGEFTGGLLGYSSAPISITNCSVETSEISGANTYNMWEVIYDSSVGAIVGQDAAAGTMDNCSVTGCTITATSTNNGGQFAGTYVGTSNAAASVYSNMSQSGNNINALYGRAYVGLTINGEAQTLS